MRAQGVFSRELKQAQSPGCIRWICCDKYELDKGLAAIEDSFATMESIALSTDLRKGGPALLLDLLHVLDALPREVTLVRSDLEYLLLDLPEVLSPGFRQKRLWILLSHYASVTEDRTVEAVAALRLAGTVLADILHLIVVDSIGQIEDYERMGVVSLQRDIFDDIEVHYVDVETAPAEPIQIDGDGPILLR